MVEMTNVRQINSESTRIVNGRCCGTVIPQRDFSPESSETPASIGVSDGYTSRTPVHARTPTRTRIRKRVNLPPSVCVERVVRARWSVDRVDLKKWLYGKKR